MIQSIKELFGNITARAVLVLVGLFLLLGCLSLLLGQNLFFTAAVRLGLLAPPPVRQFEAIGAPAAEWYEAYFTNPACPPSRQRRNGIDQLIADDIRAATTSVDLAAFELNATPIIRALRDAAQTGKRVRVVVDSAETEAGVLNQLRNAGVTAVGDERSALMHNKFVIIDEELIWSGSLNYTDNGSYCNANNAVRMIDPALAANFTTELDEMIDSLAFGPTSPSNTPQEMLTIEGVRVENYFASEREVAPIIAQRIAEAENEILFMAYSFTNEEIGEALLDQARAGLAVQGVFETTGAGTEYSYFEELDQMRGTNVRVRKDGSAAVMHHKVFIIDQEIVIFGSFNFTDSANDNNDENVVIIHDPRLASQFAGEFAAVWRSAPGLGDWVLEQLGIDF
jgi:phosphatidylserine/phosphatidylglycerophosphate/cardiolipin synthase-like enzyme